MYCLFCLYVESVLRYGLLIWGNGNDIDKVFVAQKRCIRSICDIAPDVSCRPYFKVLKILPLPCLYILELCKFVKQHPNIFKKASDITQRGISRNPDRLVVDMVPKTSRIQKNCYVMCVTVFNKIPNEIKQLPRNRFITALNIWLLNCTFYSVKEFLDYK